MKKCFVSPICNTADCPNIQCINAGLDKIPCNLCYWNTGECKDCLFEKNPDYCSKEMKEESRNDK